MVANSDPGGPYDALLSIMNVNHRSAGEIDLLTVVDATAPNADRLVRDYLAAISKDVNIPTTPVRSSRNGPMTEFYTPQRWSWLKANRYLGTSHIRLWDPALRGDYKSAYHRKNYTDKQIAVLYKHLTSTDLDNPTAVAQMGSYGGQVNAVSRTATAQVHRDSKFKTLYEVHWSDPADDTANLTWLRGLYEEVYGATGGVPVPDDQTDGCYINYCDIDLNDPAHNRSGVPWSTLYWAENYPMLQRVKARWDPKNFFRHGQSIRLP
jgi:hypothetical protein